MDKLVDELPSSDLPRVRDDADANIVSDGDANHIHGSDLEGVWHKYFSRAEQRNSKGSKYLWCALLLQQVL